MRRDLAGDGIGRVAVGAAVHPCTLAGHVVGQLTLIEDGLAAVAVPDDLVLFEVFDCQAECGDVVAIDDQAVVCDVHSPADGGLAVVGTPDPGVV